MLFRLNHIITLSLFDVHNAKIGLYKNKDTTNLNEENVIAKLDELSISIYTLIIKHNNAYR